MLEEQAAFSKNQGRNAETMEAARNEAVMSYQKQEEDEGVNSYS